MKPTFSIGITLVPERLQMAINLRKELLRQNPSAHVTFYTDATRSGVWANTEKTWQGYNKKNSHYVILQEDTFPCPNFFNHLTSAIEAKPDECISLYLGYSDKNRMNKAIKKNIHWFKFKQWMTGQGVVLPTKYISPFLKWTDRHISRKIKRNCDARLNAWLLENNKYIWQTIPELIDHLGGENSTLVGPSKTKRGYILAGEEPIDWSLGINGEAFEDKEYAYFKTWIKKWYIE